MTDDFVAAFGLDNAPVRGRIVRLGAGALDSILRRHDYPRAAAMLLGESIALAGLLGSLLKTDNGRLIVQAQGDGPISLLVGEYHQGGGLRGYARLAEDAAKYLTHAHRLPPRDLIGEGALAITLEAEDRVPHQGFVDLSGPTLAACAEMYFAVSEQTETRIRLAVGEVIDAEGKATWRAGGVLLQRIAADDARGDPEEDWSRAGFLFATLTDAELIDPDLPSDLLLYRLFHEEGVRMAEPALLRDQCTCDEGRLIAVMRQFTAEEVDDLTEPDGLLHAKCQFCARIYKIAPEALRA